MSDYDIVIVEVCAACRFWEPARRGFQRAAAASEDLEEFKQAAEIVEVCEKGSRK
jgi:hypothetical protein